MVLFCLPHRVRTVASEVLILYHKLDSGAFPFDSFATKRQNERLNIGKSNIGARRHIENGGQRLSVL
jgi:hypothetical protein